MLVVLCLAHFAEPSILQGHACWKSQDLLIFLWLNNFSLCVTLSVSIHLSTEA